MDRLKLLNAALIMVTDERCLGLCDDQGIFYSIPRGHPVTHVPAGLADFVRQSIPRGHPVFSYRIKTDLLFPAVWLAFLDQFGILIG